MSSFGVELLEVFQRSFSQEADLHFIKFSNKRSRCDPEREMEERERGIVWIEPRRHFSLSGFLSLALLSWLPFTPCYSLKSALRSFLFGGKLGASHWESERGAGTALQVNCGWGKEPPGAGLLEAERLAPSVRGKSEGGVEQREREGMFSGGTLKPRGLHLHFNAKWLCHIISVVTWAQTEQRNYKAAREIGSTGKVKLAQIRKRSVKTIENRPLNKQNSTKACFPEWCVSV